MQLRRAASIVTMYRGCIYIFVYSMKARQNAGILHTAKIEKRKCKAWKHIKHKKKKKGKWEQLKIKDGKKCGNVFSGWKVEC